MCVCDSKYVCVFLSMCVFVGGKALFFMCSHVCVHVWVLLIKYIYLCMVHALLHCIVTCRKTDHHALLLSSGAFPVFSAGLEPCLCHQHRAAGGRGGTERGQ